MYRSYMHLCPMYSQELIKGTLQTIVLSLLSEHPRMYGYEMTQHVKERTEGRIQLTEGALYPTLHRMEAEGLLITELESIGKRVRKYYRLTQQGDTQATARIVEFRSFMDTMSQLLRPLDQQPILAWNP